MTILPDLTAALAGLLLVLWVLWDVFQTVIVPRPTPARYRLARYLAAVTWPIWRRRALRLGSSAARERFLGTYAPLYVVALLVCWVVVLVVGYGLVLWAVRGQLSPIPGSLGDAVYAAGVSLLTIGFGDLVPIGPVARIVELLAAGTGLGVVALTITYLFSLFAAFQRREMLVTTLDARAGAPPSGIALLETIARTGMVDRLDDLLHDWEVWCAEVLDSHVAYPILCYFRSSHDNESWVSALGAILDASTLILTTVEGLPRGQAEMTHRIGGHLVEDVGSFFGHGPNTDPGVDADEFDEARRRLAVAGFTLRERDLSWALFSQHRSGYASRLNSLATYWLTPPAQWVGDRGRDHHS